MVKTEKFSSGRSRYRLRPAALLAYPDPPCRQEFNVGRQKQFNRLIRTSQRENRSETSGYVRKSICFVTFQAGRLVLPSTEVKTLSAQGGNVAGIVLWIATEAGWTGASA